MKKLIVNTDKPTLISKYIIKKFPNLKFSTLNKALRNKDIKVNQNRINKDVVINNLDSLEIYIDDRLLYNIPDKIKFYLNDENLVIAYKWQGVLTNSEDPSKLDEPTLEDIIKDVLNIDYLKACHRLDRNTSGLIIFAKSESALCEMKRVFSESRLKKYYIAYVNNYKFSKMSDKLTAYLTKDSKNGYSKVTNGKLNHLSEKITTEYNVLYQNKQKDYAILEVLLHTGKTHQIRAHLAFIGHEIIGDSKYGRNAINRKFKKTRQLLVAYKYVFNLEKTSFLSYLNDMDIQIEKEELNLL